ncbi:YqaJ viral recombinase family protein [Mycolicibacterium canariasense]|uniref:YqaJ viral recombinase family protein n=1 Tax=Mycolicibacterium canariasense TaxID=228230 RepID=UPI0032D57C1C
MSHIIAVNRPGDKGWIAPGSEEHTRMISPSKVAAILGESRWQSPFGLWMEMTGRVEPDPPKDIYQVGHDFEPAIANRWLSNNPGWKLSPGEVQFVIDPEHFGFPAVATLDRRAVRGRARRIVQLKIARDLDDADTWGDDFSDPDSPCPADYELQVFAEMLFTGLTRLPGHLCAVGPFWTEKIYPIAYEKSAAAQMITEVRDFYASLKNNAPPDLDNTKATYQTVRKMHPDIAAGTGIQIDPDLARDYLTAIAAHKASETRLREMKTRIQAAMGDNESAFVGNVPIAKRARHASGSVQLNSSRKTKPEDITKGSAA